MKRSIYKGGFTLIEVIIYLALFTILMGGALSGAVNLFDGAGRDTTHAMLQTEGEFLLAKVAWALSGTQAVNAPAAGHGGSLLSVNKVTGLDGAGQPILSAVTFDLDPTTNTDIRITDGSSTPEQLNNTNIQVTSLNFFYATSSGTGITPEAVGVRMTLSVHTPQGQVLTQDFFATTSLRQ